MDKIKDNFWQTISLILIAYLLISYLINQNQQNQSDDLVREYYLIYLNNSITVRNQLNEQGINNAFLDNVIFDGILGLSLIENQFSSQNSKKLLSMVACNMKKSHTQKPFHGNSYAQQINRNDELMNNLEIFLNKVSCKVNHAPPLHPGSPANRNLPFRPELYTV